MSDGSNNKSGTGSELVEVVTPSVARRPARFPIVGIGASAGGIEALGQLFDAMPLDTGCAFVIVLHLDPKRESEMAHILATHTTMPVAQIEQGMSLAADHIYVIAPDTDIEVRNNVLHVSRPTVPRGQRHPVDVLFKSLAADQQDRSIAIILSGTGSNGTEGLRDIRAQGGVSFVQTPETAKFDGMPRSAISAQLADFVLAPDEMPAALRVHLDHGEGSAAIDNGFASPNAEASIHQLLDLLRARGGHDFRHYKHTTLGRRIRRRLGLRNIDTLDKYVEELRTDDEEVQTLSGDLLISVTEFFRDADAWKTLADLVIAPMIAEREAGSSIRVWVPACSTGEEPYSIAMLITEQAAAVRKRFDLKVFATDAQDINLVKAREGIYTAAAMAAFPAARLQRFFEPVDGSWQVSKTLRDMVVFATHNLLRDPPFSRLDLISCRNVLIYLEPEGQKQIIALCHFGLQTGGHLFLGNAETIGHQDKLFETISKKWRIYKKRPTTRHDRIGYPLALNRTKLPNTRKPVVQSATPVLSIADLARRALLDHYAPASVLIDRQDRILYFHGATGDYLEQPTGEPTTDVLVMARDGLALELSPAIRQAALENRTVTVDAVMRSENRSVTMTVAPVLASSQGAGCLLVSFADTASPLDPATQDGLSSASKMSSSDHDLQQQLATVRGELMTSVENLETANEELKASNEEATSMNEELQSTNEELETSKEELQSFNEELNTVNSQLQHKIGELESATNDLENLLTGSETATLFLDDKFCIKWFSPATKELIDLVASDVGRPIAHFAQKFADANLLRDAETVLKKLATIEAEVPGEGGRWYLRRMLPYRTGDNRIAGVVVTFIDITMRKLEEEALKRSEGRLQELIEALPCAVYITDADGRISFFNPAVAALWGRSPEIGTYDATPLFWPDGAPIPKSKNPLTVSLTEQRPIRGVEIAVDRPDGVRMPFFAYTALLRDDAGHVRGAVNMLVDITESRRAEAAERRLAAIVESSDDAIISKSLDGIITSWNKGAERLFGYTAAEMVGTSILRLVPADRRDEEVDIIGRIRRGEHVEHYETVRQRSDGSEVCISLTISPLWDVQGNIIGASKIARDMTERRRSDEHRKTLIDELNHRVKNTLAVVQSIAFQTLGTAATVEDARNAFGSRLINLATAHDVLTRENWAGADLIDVVTDTVSPHAGGENRFLIDGPPTRLSPSAALAIAMALHELCTNAAKYGALSSDTGHVEIRWSLLEAEDNLRLTLTWAESGGPPVTPPKRKGFGSRLIEKALARELRGEVHLEYRPTGVVCTIEAPLPKPPSGDIY